MTEGEKWKVLAGLVAAMSFGLMIGVACGIGLTH